MELKFNFLEDKPLEGDKLINAKFGHKEVANSLTSIIKKCKTPFSIALCGSWGSGKSSISNLVRNKLESDKTIGTVYFDVWKYEGDALRRSFLIETINQLKEQKFIDNSFSLADRLQNSVTRKSEGGLKFNKQLFKDFKGPLILIIICLLIILATFYLFGYLYELWLVLAPFIGIVGGASLVPWIIKLISSVFSTETVTFGSDRFQDPHEFEDEFGNLLNEYSGTRLLVIFDNLDRVEHDKALKVLSTIKTFLEPKDIEILDKDVVFLIPCDLGAIKEHIRGVYDNDNATAFNEDEFIRKYFNTIVMIPDFIETELEEYALSYLKDTNVDQLHNHFVSWLMARVFRNNPRQIKQFINYLLASYLLIQERVDIGQLRKGDIQIPQLAKFLIIEVNYSKILEELKNNKLYNLEELDYNLLSSLSKNKNEIDDFKSFINDTSHFPIKNLQIFLTLRHSEQEQKLPGSESLIIALKDGVQQEVEKYFESLKDFNKFNHLITQIIKQELLNTRNVESRFIIIKTLLPILDKNKYDLNPVIYPIFANFFLKNPNKYLKGVSTNLVFSEILKKESSKEYINPLVDRYIEIIKKHDSDDEQHQLSDDYLHSIIIQIPKHYEWFLRYDNVIQDILGKYFAKSTEVIQLFSENEVIQKKYISNKFVLDYIDNFDSDEIGENSKSNFNKKIEGLRSLHQDYWSEIIIKRLINVTKELIASENLKTDEDRINYKNNLFSALNLLFRHLSIPLNKVSSIEEWKTLIIELHKSYDSISSTTNKKIIIPLLFTLTKIISNELLNQVKEDIINFINNDDTGLEEFKFICDHATKSWFDDESIFLDNFKERAIQNNNNFSWIYENLSEKEKTNLLVKLVNKSVDNFIKAMSDLNNNVPSEKEILNAVISRFKVVTNKENRKSLYDICNVLKCANDENIINLFNQHLSEELTVENNDLRDVIYTTFKDAEYISEDKKRQTIKSIIEWLNNIENNPKQEESINTIVDNWKLLSGQARQKDLFIGFIFDKLLVNNSPIDNIEYGFHILSKLGIDYGDYQSNFGDIKERIINESDEDIKKVIMDGLVQYKSDESFKNYFKELDKITKKSNKAE